MKNTITATHFYNYVQCPTRVYLAYHGDLSQKLKASDFMEKKIKEGVAHEKSIVKTLKAAEIKEAAPEKAFAKTLELMKRGVGLIYQGVLMSDNLVGRPDLLKKQKGKSRLGNYYYVIEDIKLGHHVKEEYKMQIAFYNHLLGKVQGVAPKTGAVILWNNSISRFEPDEKRFQEVLASIQEIAKGKKLEPVLRSVCKECGWREHCLDQLKAKEDISLVFRLSRKAKALLNQENITSLSNLAIAGIQKLDGLSEASIKKFKLQAESLIKNKVLILGSPNLPKTKLEIYFDIEGDTATETRYLFGILINNKYHYLLARTSGEEEKAWKDFINFFKDKNDFTIYHYGGYEKIELRKLKEKYGCDKIVYNKIVKSMVDLYKVILKTRILPIYSYSIKDVAKYLGFKWKNEKAGGAQSMFWYELWLETKSIKWLDLILEYNQDDCKATKIVKDWLAL